ncbi:MAG TPA: NAD(+)/NADH kinase [Acidimicrobiales bacterium]|nr:NAD(+)/NADH kinase [Acidimicrobiales bacterium]
MATVVLVLHPGRPEAVRLASEAMQWLAERGHQVRMPKDDASAAGLESVEALAEDQAVAGADLAVSLGGDGTMLRTVGLASSAEVPVLGVNLGQLGYLTAIEPARLTDALARFMAGDHHIEERLSLEVVGPAGEKLVALNEAVLEKTVPGHTVRLCLSISGERFISYAADGLIVSTPTGSTAYNLSARGPILSPRLAAILVTPVSPHMLFDRSLVLESDETVQVDVMEPRPAVLVVDGIEVGVLDPGDTVRCRRGEHPARFVSFSDGRGFHSILKAKFGLSDR